MFWGIIRLSLLMPKLHIRKSLQGWLNFCTFLTLSFFDSALDFINFPYA
jgi:hypothetical protein